MGGFAPSGTYGTRSIGTSAAIIANARSARNSLLVQNNHATNSLYVGTDSSVTTSTGVKVGPGGDLSFDDYAGDVYGIASGASTDVRYLEAY